MEVSGQIQAPVALTAGEYSRDPLDKRLGALEGWSWQFGECNNVLPLPALELPTPSRSLLNLVTVLPELAGVDRCDYMTSLFKITVT
jgi:hypothetical protein